MIKIERSIRFVGKKSAIVIANDIGIYFQYEGK